MDAEKISTPDFAKQMESLFTALFTNRSIFRFGIN